jgi:hypothetical protein
VGVFPGRLYLNFQKDKRELRLRELPGGAEKFNMRGFLKGDFI